MLRYDRLDPAERAELEPPLLQRQPEAKQEGELERAIMRCQELKTRWEKEQREAKRADKK